MKLRMKDRMEDSILGLASGILSRQNIFSGEPRVLSYPLRFLIIF